MNGAPQEAENRDLDRSRRGRVLLAVVVASVLHVVLRFTFPQSIGRPPYQWSDRAAWWLPPSP